MNQTLNNLIQECCFFSELLGINKQGAVGFLTLMESLRYCKVRFLKLSCESMTDELCYWKNSSLEWNEWMKALSSVNLNFLYKIQLHNFTQIINLPS